MPSGAVTANTWQQAVQDSVSSVGLNIVQNSNPIYQDFQGASQIIYPGTTLDPSAAFLIGTADDIANAVGSIFDLPGLESQDPSINGGTPMIAMEDEIGQPWCDFDYNDFVTVLQVQQATTTTVSSSLNPSTVGQAVTFTATVTPASGTFDGGGSVQFTVGGTSLGSVSLNGASTVTIQDTNLNNAGNYTVEAVYSGDTNFTRQQRDDETDGQPSSDDDDGKLVPEPVDGRAISCVHGHGGGDFGHLRRRRVGAVPRERMESRHGKLERCQHRHDPGSQLGHRRELFGHGGL